MGPSQAMERGREGWKERETMRETVREHNSHNPANTLILDFGLQNSREMGCPG